MQTCDVAVVGAGIIGAACACELASSGLRVAVVDADAGASGTASLSNGALSLLLDENPAQFALTRFGLALWDKLAEALPSKCAFQRRGTLWIATADDQMERAILGGAFLERQGIHAELVDRHQLAESEPGLRRDLEGGLYVPGDASIQAGPAAEFLLQQAMKQGVEHIRQPAVSLANHEVLLQDGTRLQSGSIINATGGHSLQLTPELPLEFSKGHALIVETQGPCARHHISELTAQAPRDAPERVRFEVLPNPSSQLWIGSSCQPATWAVSVKAEPRVVALVLRRAIETLPAIGRARPLRSWAGLRATTADGLPLIGRVPGREFIIAAAGYNNYGACAALSTARLIADELLCRISEIDPKPYRVDRLSNRGESL